MMFRTEIRSVLAIVCAAGMSSACFAQNEIIVQGRPNASSAWQPIGSGYANKGDQIDINNPGNGWLFRIKSNTSLYPGQLWDIGLVRFTGTTNNRRVTLIIGGAADVVSGGGVMSFGVEDWGGLEPNQADVLLQAAAFGDITGDVEADHIWRIDAGGDISGDLIHNRGGDWKNHLFVSDTYAIVAGGNVSGDFRSFVSGGVAQYTVGGNLTGDIRVGTTTVHAAIGTITVAGDIGTPSSPVQITAGVASAGPSIERISADNVYADINAVISGAYGDIRKFDVGAGVFEGTLKVRRFIIPSLTSDVFEFGTLDADVEFVQRPNTSAFVYDGGFAAGRTIWIPQEYLNVPASSRTDPALSFLADTGNGEHSLAARWF